jgi:hypothetical protein
MSTSGFSAQRVSTAQISSNYQFANPWSVALPYYNDGSFNTSTGVFTVPYTGMYQINATIPYSTYTMGTSIGSSLPNFAIQVNGTTILASDMPSYGTLPRYTSTDATASMGGQFFLTAGSQVTLSYVANGNTVGYDFGPSAARPAVWSMRRII